MPDRPIFLSRLALPMAWEALGQPPSHEDCEKAAWANAGVVGFLSHGADLEAAHRSSDEHLTEALAPLRIKLDVVIELLGRLTYRDVRLPEVRDVELGMTRIAWYSPQPLQCGEWLKIKLYFDQKFLEPIILFGCVVSAVKDEAEGGCSVQAELAASTIESEEGFARLAFLAQRRQLAHRPGQAARVER
jgi:hypothetical protein